MHQEEADSFRSIGQLEAAANSDWAVSAYREGLAEEKGFSTRSLGRFTRTRLGLAPLHLLFLPDYIAAKAGRLIVEKNVKQRSLLTSLI